MWTFFGGCYLLKCYQHTTKKYFNCVCTSASAFHASVYCSCLCSVVGLFFRCFHFHFFSVFGESMQAANQWQQQHWEPYWSCNKWRVKIYTFFSDFVSSLRLVRVSQKGERDWKMAWCFVSDCGQKIRMENMIKWHMLPAERDKSIRINSFRLEIVYRLQALS